jgi:hypothetical protein
MEPKLDTRLGNQTVLGGIVAALAIAILLGVKAAMAAMATAVALLLLLMVVEGVRIVRQEFSNHQFTDAILTALSYLAGVLVLVVGLFEVVVTRGPAKAGEVSSQLVGLALVMLLFVFLFGLVREGSSALKVNLARKRAVLATANVVVLVVGCVAALAGIRKLAQIFLHR